MSKVTQSVDGRIRIRIQGVGLHSLLPYPLQIIHAAEFIEGRDPVGVEAGLDRFVRTGGKKRERQRALQVGARM